MFIKYVMAFILVSLPLLSEAAKPTDTEVLNQITRPNMQDVKLSKSGGTFSTYDLQHWWTRGVTYRINAGIKEFPNATIKVGAEARYRIVGGNYDFDKLKTAWNEYEGIPLPSDDKLLSLLKKNIVKFVVAYNWNQMVSELKGPILSKDPAVRKVEWHTANSFTIHVQAKYSVISSYTEVQDKMVDYAVRFYRGGIKQPWKEDFYSSKSEEEVLATHKYSSDEIKAMPTQASLAAEKQAQAATSNLPSINVPEFSNDKEAFAYIYKNLRTGDKKQIEAMFRAMASPFYFVEGSKIRLNNRGEETLAKVIKQVFDNKITFAKSYCPQLYVQSYQTNMINIVDALKKNKSRIALTMNGGRYERGKKIGQEFKISALEIWTLRTDDDVEQLKSWPFAELCTNTGKTFNQLKTGASSTTQSNPRQKPTTTQSSALITAPVKTWNWTRFKSNHLPVSMKIIGQATESQKSSKTGNLVTTMISDSSEGSFRMDATDYKRELTEDIANPFHIKMAKNVVKANNALIHKKQTMQIGTGTAQIYMIERGSGANKVMVKFIIFSHGSVAYQMMYSQYKSKFDKARADEFINSIKLL